MLRRLFFYYCFLSAAFIFLTGMLSSKTGAEYASQLFFLPVLLYFCYSFLMKVQGLRYHIPFSSNRTYTVVLISVGFFSILAAFSIVRALYQPTATTAQDAPISGAPAPADILSPVTTSPTPAVSPLPPAVQLKIQEKFQKNSVAVREAASSSATIVGTLTYGRTYPMTSKEGSWYQIEFEQKSGFVDEKYIEASQ